MTRSNGLGAPAYAAVAEFTPALGDGAAEALLWRLETAGVAAYLDARDGVDELYVDTRRVDQACRLLDAAGGASIGVHTGAAAGADPTPSAPQVAVDEDVWAALVEAYNTPTAQWTGRWPSLEDLDQTEGGSGDGVAGAGELRFDEPVRRRPPAGDDDAGVPAGQSDEGSGASRPPEPAEHFQPPEPPPLPRLPLRVLSGWLCATVIPVVLVVLGLLGIALPTALLLLAAGLFVYGIGVLFSQLRSVPVDSDGERLDGDDGAEV